jgi:hypothetical protein
MIRSAIQSVWKKASRYAVLSSVFFLPKEKRIEVERWLRGREQFGKLRRADCVVVSFGKSGRTWLRVMISRFYQVKHGLSERHLIGFDNLHYINKAIPKIFFTHDNYLKDYTKNIDSKADYYDTKIVLLVRHPADVAVSQYFQWQYRMPENKKELNKYPEHGQEIPIFDFVMNADAGLRRVIDFMNGWANEIDRLKSLLIVRYEDMRAQPEATLARILEFIGTPGTAGQVREAVAFASVENMRKLEEKQVFWLSGGRMKAADQSNPDSFKVRRAKVGGYRDYFEDEQVAQIDARVRADLSPRLGYTAGDDGSKVQAVGA